MYDCRESIYCYKNTNILKNKLNIKDEEVLKDYQTRVVAFKLSTINFIEMDNNYDALKLKFIHKYLFSDIYYFAGEYRKENISKENFRFSEFEYIEKNIDKILNNIDILKLRQLSFDKLVIKYSYFLTELNVLHPFREGNGRAIREFVRQLAYESRIYY